MNGYVKKSDVIRLLRGECVAKYPQSFLLGLLAAASEIEKMPSGDVASGAAEVEHGTR